MTVRGFHAFRGLLLPDQTTRMLDFACKLPIYNKQHIEGPGFGMFGIRGRLESRGLQTLALLWKHNCSGSLLAC